MHLGLALRSIVVGSPDRLSSHGRPLLMAALAMHVACLLLSMQSVP